jgi:uncharacterized Tic20 family protein
MPGEHYEADDERDRDEDEDERESSVKRKRHGPTSEDKQMAMFCHLGNVLGMIVLPLVLWLTQREKSSFIDELGKEAVNFGITLLMGHVIGGFCTCGLLTFIILPLGIVFGVMSGMAASRGEDYAYPICIRFIK